MKKFITMLVVALLGLCNQSSAANTQNDEQKSIGWPLLPYNENGYTIEFVREFVKAPAPGYKLETQADFIRSDWVKELVKITNENLARTKTMQVDASGQFTDKLVVVDESNIDWILKNSYDSVVVGLKNYSNSRKPEKFSTNVTFFTDPASFTGQVRVFRYLNCSFIIYKCICINLMGDPIFVKPPQVVAPPIAKKDTVYREVIREVVKEAQCCPTGLSVDDYVKILKAQTEAFVAMQQKAEPTSNGVEYSKEEYYTTREVVVVEPRPQVIRPRMGWSGFVNLNIRGGGRQHPGVHQTPIVRTMSTGIPAGNNSPGGGVGGVVRTMSPGLRN